MSDHSSLPLTEIVIDDGKEQANNKTDEIFPTIFQIKSSLKESNPGGAYEPSVISLGPYHHGNELLKPMEKLKVKLFNDLLLRTGIEANVFIESVKEIADEADKCYAKVKLTDGDDNDDDDAFNNMMVIDACFLLELLLKTYDVAMKRGKKNGGHEGGTKNGTEKKVNGLFKDLMLLENQIPFFVLEKVFGLVPNISICLLDLFIWWIKGIYDPHFENSNLFQIELSRKPHHLLDLIGLVMFRTINPELNTDSISSPIEPIPSAVELEKRCVKFQGIKEGGLRVTFADGDMSMRSIVVDEKTEVCLRNLVAFEQGYLKAGFAASSYAVFMGCLIKEPKDVAVLSEERNSIIINKLKDNEEAAAVFSNICKGVEIHREGPIYQDINIFCRSFWKRLKAVHRRTFSWKELCIRITTLLIINSLGQVLIYYYLK